VRLDLADVSALVARVLPADLGGPAARITLATPDGVRITTPAGVATARIALRSDGGLDLLVSTPQTAPMALNLLEPGDALPVRVSGVAIGGGDLVLSGTVDARSLGL